MQTYLTGERMPGRSRTEALLEQIPHPIQRKRSQSSRHNRFSRFPATPDPECHSGSSRPHRERRLVYAPGAGCSSLQEFTAS